MSQAGTEAELATDGTERGARALDRHRPQRGDPALAERLVPLGLERDNEGGLASLGERVESELDVKEKTVASRESPPTTSTLKARRYAASSG